MAGGARKADRNRWQRQIIRHLSDFPRQYAALEHAMSGFGPDFDLREFKNAFNTSEDIDAYSRVQAVERALGRVQNFVADLAQDGVKLAQLPPAPDQHTSPANKAFAALQGAGVINRQLCRRVIRAQEARTSIEHGYIDASAGRVHSAAKLIHDSARDFIQPYRTWIEPHLTDRTSEQGQ